MKPLDIKIRNAVREDKRLRWPAKALVSYLVQELARGEDATLSLEAIRVRCDLGADEMREALAQSIGARLIELGPDSVDVEEAAYADFSLVIRAGLRRAAQSPLDFEGGPVGPGERADRRRCGQELDAWGGSEYHAEVSEADGDRFRLEIVAVAQGGGETTRQTLFSDGTFDTPEQAWGAWDEWRASNRPDASQERFGKLEIQEGGLAQGTEEAWLDKPTHAGDWERRWEEGGEERSEVLTVGPMPKPKRRLAANSEARPEPVAVKSLPGRWRALSAPEPKGETPDPKRASKKFKVTLQDSSEVAVAYIAPWSPESDYFNFKGPVNERGEHTWYAPVQLLTSAPRPIEEIARDRAEELRAKYLKSLEPAS